MSTALTDIHPTPDTSADGAAPVDESARGEVAHDLPRTVIEPTSGWRAVNVAEVWRHRELLFFLAWRDVKVRYKQTVLGAAWAIVQPVLTMAVFSLFFGRLGGLARQVPEGTPYPIFVFAGLLPWLFFANAVTQSGQSLVASSHLISKVYFPRLIVPLASVGTGMVDFAVSAVVLLLMMAYYGVAWTSQLLLAPLFVAGTLLAAVGVGTLLSALVAAYRDFKHVIAFLVQLWMFATPVAYPASIVPEQWRTLYALNPMVGLIGGFRSSVLGQPYDWPAILVSLLTSAALLAAGLLYFRRVERRFADII